uniref:Uncharacterized protein n=1 Tax=Anopheles farauti TaxID=69004 RepID=A0A182QFR3_9DIPT
MALPGGQRMGADKSILDAGGQAFGGGAGQEAADGVQLDDSGAQQLLLGDGDRVLVEHRYQQPERRRVPVQCLVQSVDGCVRIGPASNLQALGNRREGTCQLGDATTAGWHSRGRVRGNTGRAGCGTFGHRIPLGPIIGRLGRIGRDKPLERFRSVQIREDTLPQQLPLGQILFGARYRHKVLQPLAVGTVRRTVRLLPLLLDRPIDECDCFLEVFLARHVRQVEVGIVEELVECDAPSRITLQQARQQLPAVGRDRGPRRYRDRIVPMDPTGQLVQCVRAVRCRTEQTLVQYHAHAPQVRLRTVRTVQQYLRRHIQRRTLHRRVLLVQLQPLGEPKVTNLQHVRAGLLRQQQVGRLQVEVAHVVLAHVAQGERQLLQKPLARAFVERAV